MSLYPFLPCVKLYSSLSAIEKKKNIRNREFFENFKFFGNVISASFFYSLKGETNIEIILFMFYATNSL